MLQRREQELRLLVGLGREDVEAEHQVRLAQPLRRLEARAVDVDGVLHLGRREMRCEGIGQAEHGGELCAIGAGAEHPDLDLLALAGHGAHALPGFGRREIVDQFDDVLREIVGPGLEVPA